MKLLKGSPYATGYLQSGGILYCGEQDLYYGKKGTFTISLSPVPVPDYVVGTTSTDTCTATTTASNPSYVWTCLIDGVLNQGVTDQIKGANTATMSLTYNFTSVHEHCVFRCTVTDENGNSQHADASFAIEAAATAKVQSATSSLAVTRYANGSPVSDQLTVIPSPADDGTYMYTYSIDSDLFTISDTGLITGLASTNGTYTASCVVVDLYGNEAPTSSAFTVTTEYAHLTGVSVSPATLSVVEGDPVDQVFTLTPTPADDGTYKYSASFSGASDGLTITNNNDGTFKVSGTTTATGNVVIAFTCTDSYSKAYNDNAVITITVPAAHLTSASASLDNTTATVGTAYTGQITTTCKDPDDGTYKYTYALNGQSYGLSVSSTGAITGTPTAAGTAGFKVTVTDSYNATQSAYVNITVSEAASAAKLSTATAVNPSWVKGSAAKQAQEFNLDDPDDGSYTYTWTAFSGDSTGAGYIYPGNSTTPVTLNTAYPSQTFYWDTNPRGGNTTNTGNPTAKVTITDTYNKAISVNIKGSVTLR
ncbi:Uncharacterised protein [Klebsiella quasipneumoniae]|nr:Uncharacterised protein [Klebsiella quasipneumoniae]SXD22847.1 Uncharacterised protein [Klebsiella quasipneumoniae]HDT5956529.1 hypothetical protein [Klebsiella quasipneumoniae subsp. similipneumoniae]